MKVREASDGLDFEFKEWNDAVKFVEFIQAKFIVWKKESKQLISHNANTGVSIYKYSYSLELPPICKDDIIYVPPKLSKSLGGVSPLLLVWKLG